MKNQMCSLTHFSIILVLWLALSPCKAHSHKQKDTSENKVEPPLASVQSENPEEGSGGSDSHDGRTVDHSYTSFSSAFADILKGTLRGPTVTTQDHTEPKSDASNSHHRDINQICSHTDYPDVCLRTVKPFLSANFDLMKVLEASIKACMHQANFTISVVLKHMNSSPELNAALADCKEHYTNALENLRRAMGAIPSHDLGTVTVMLSAVMADVSACESGFEDRKASVPVHAEGMVSITASNCLSIASLIPY